MAFDLERIEKEFLSSLREIRTRDELENLRIKYFGRKRGILTKIASSLPSLSLNEKKILGPIFNHLKGELSQSLKERESGLSSASPKPTKEIKQKPSTSSLLFDPTAPGKKVSTGHQNPVISVIEEIKEIFHYLGFTYIDGPEVDLDLYNFQKLRIGKDHPARDTQQTYYLNDEVVLRTHTSSMQVRYMETHKPPIRVLFPGRTFRRDPVDATHLPSFYQIEGLLVDNDSSMTDLIGTLDFVIKRFFGSKTKTRVYGHYFPYTEPSIEVEVLHKNGKWMEILGAGMVHPEVLKNGRIDPRKYRGWAFGMGPERMAMLKYGINDIRLFYNGDLRFINQF